MKAVQIVLDEKLLRTADRSPSRMREVRAALRFALGCDTRPGV